MTLSESYYFLMNDVMLLEFGNYAVCVVQSSRFFQMIRGQVIENPREIKAVINLCFNWNIHPWFLRPLITWKKRDDCTTQAS